ncbi:MAG TPA: carboxymuconolactone decarboxylase family protein [Terriglobia bacterium]|nr:carboxymuconolactone decarboxylase family protein [Terriglobia bacterium]
MNRNVLWVTIIGFMTIAGVFALGQAPSQREAPPATEQLRQTVSRLRGNRIDTPNDWDKLTPQQKKYVESILSGPRSDISGPLGVMMVTPELGDLVQKAVTYARFAGREGFSSVPPKLNELAILVVARHWSAEYVWSAHHTAAVRFGLPAEVVEGIRTGKRAEAMERDVEAVYNFATEFITKRDVTNTTLQAARNVLGGDRGVVDLVGTMSLYQISSMMAALDQTPLPPGTKPYLH